MDTSVCSHAEWGQPAGDQRHRALSESLAPGWGSQPAVLPAFPRPCGLISTCARPLTFWPQFPLYEMGCHHVPCLRLLSLLSCCPLWGLKREAPTGSSMNIRLPQLILSCSHSDTSRRELLTGPVKKTTLPGKGLFKVTRSSPGPGQGCQTLPKAGRKLGVGETSCAQNRQLLG